MGVIPDERTGVAVSDEANTTHLAIRELCEALRLTVEYVGTGLLPPNEGWSWFCALKKYAPEDAAYMKAEYEKRIEEFTSEEPHDSEKPDVVYANQVASNEATMKAFFDEADTPPQPENDPVNHPSHYTAYKGLEIIDLTEQMNFNRGNAVKYIARAGLKDKEHELEDLEKAIWYTQREIQRIKNTSKEAGL